MYASQRKYEINYEKPARRFCNSFSTFFTKPINFDFSSSCPVSYFSCKNARSCPTHSCASCFGLTARCWLFSLGLPRSLQWDVRCLDTYSRWWRSPPDWLIYSFIQTISIAPLQVHYCSETARILCRTFTPKRHRQLQVNYLPKVSMWRRDRDSNPRPFGRKATNQPMSHHAPQFRSSRSVAIKKIGGFRFPEFSNNFVSIFMYF